MGLPASTGKLPSLFFENKVHPKCRSREGRQEINTRSKARPLGREAPGRRQAPSSAETLPSVNTTEPEVTVRTEGICSRKELQTTPPSSGQRAEPEMPARPWTLGPGARRAGEPGVLMDGPFKGALCAALVVEARPDGGHLSGCSFYFVLGRPATGPRCQQGTCHQPFLLPDGAGGSAVTSPGPSHAHRAWNPSS